jgi:16S rRNA C967 or C1407 C5-methylase (RsmB/RsmF family)/NOL1/NOP2/fmu family ribosome biogenesis protein
VTTFFPAELINSLAKLDYFDTEAFLSAHESGNQVVSVHMNPGKQILHGANWNENIKYPPFEISSPVPWADDAYYLSSRPNFTYDPLFHAGCYYVQEASGLFLSFALKQTLNLSEKLSVLDLCAAPGGKSTMLLSLISSESLLVSNEVIKSRVPALNQNITKWGRPNGIISNNDPAHFKQLPGFFDLILIDAPCSGSGLYRKDPEAGTGWSTDLVNLCSQRQKRIVADVWDSLKDEGILIYSTCSYSIEENEDILDSIFRQYPCESIILSPDKNWNIVETISQQAGAYGYRFYPDKVRGEGFFLAVIRKKKSATNPLISLPFEKHQKLNRKSAGISRSGMLQLDKWINESSLEFLAIGDSFHAVPKAITAEFELLKSHLYLRKAGVRLGKSGGSEWIPDHELAVAIVLKEDYPYLDFEKAEALRYLRGEPVEYEKNRLGWHIACFQGQRLGWVKLLDSRMNNYYPKAWRIRQ